MRWWRACCASSRRRRDAARSSSCPHNSIPSMKTASGPSRRCRKAAWPCSTSRNEPLLTVNAGARLDRLPLSPFHRRVLSLIGVGMFFDGFDVYVAATVLGATLKTGFSTLTQNATFVSVTFLGMMVGSFLTGFLGDRYGRRYTYQ